MCVYVFCLYTAFNFIQFNAEYLVSLELLTDNQYDIPENVVWPQFPKLRELNINYSECLPILMNSKETLEHLSLETIFSDIVYASVVMPRLTDLHMNSVNNAFKSKICSLNHRSLEFLFLDIPRDLPIYSNFETDLPNLDDGIKMDRMRNVMLDDEYTAQDRGRMTELCPNAEVVIVSEENRKEIGDQMRSRCKSKKFSMDFIKFRI